MSESELIAIRRKKLQELQKRLTSKKDEKGERVDKKKVLDKVFKGRAWEVFDAACSQYPDLMNKIGEALVKLVLAGKLKEINGEQLYTFLKGLGLRVKLNTEIRFMEHGELRSLRDKLKGEL
ncbi:MAG: hypothetical protein QXL67_03160 [Candidatus Bathyarchaeia archaeon]